MIRHYPVLILLVCLSALGSPALAGDTRVDIAPGFSGQLMVPEQATDRAVLLLHGWNSHQDEVGNLYRDLAEALAEAGIASLRFNFSGEGPQADFVMTSTFDSRVDESSRAYQYLRIRFPDASLGVQGFSLGGLTAMSIAGSHPDWFASMVLWSAAENFGGQQDPAFQKAAQQAIREGSAVLQTWTKVTLTRDHLSSFVGVNPRAGLADYPGAFLTIRGTRDFLPSHDREWLELLPTEDKAFLMIGGADHIYNVLEDPQPAYGRRAIEASVRWFDRTL